MVDFKALAEDRRSRRWDTQRVYECLLCHEQHMYVIELPRHLMRHGFDRRDRCHGDLKLVMTKFVHRGTDVEIVCGVENSGRPLNICGERAEYQTEENFACAGCRDRAVETDPGMEKSYRRMT
jgi:hypothetical protein